MSTAPHEVLCPSNDAKLPSTSKSESPSTIRHSPWTGQEQRSPTRATGRPKTSLFAAPESTRPPWLCTSPTRIMPRMVVLPPFQTDAYPTQSHLFSAADRQFTLDRDDRRQASTQSLRSYSLARTGCNRRRAVSPTRADKRCPRLPHGTTAFWGRSDSTSPAAPRRPRSDARRR